MYGAGAGDTPGAQHEQPGEHAKEREIYKRKRRDAGIAQMQQRKDHGADAHRQGHRRAVGQRNHEIAPQQHFLGHALHQVARKKEQDVERGNGRVQPEGGGSHQRGKPAGGKEHARAQQKAQPIAAQKALPHKAHRAQ